MVIYSKYEGVIKKWYCKKNDKVYGPFKSFKEAYREWKKEEE